METTKKHLTVGEQLQRFVEICGLEPKDVSCLIGIPENEITEEMSSAEWKKMSLVATILKNLAPFYCPNPVEIDLYEKP